MAYGSIHISGTIFSKRFGTFAEGAGSIYDIIHNEAVSVFHITDDVHHFGNTRFRTALFNDGNRCTYSVSQFTGTGYTAQVRGNDSQVIQVFDFT